MLNSKDILAKLLAQENITVVQKNAETASFDVKNRVLTLPTWKDMENFTYNHLVGHEVGHALYTNQNDWESAVEGKSKGYKTYLNVIEDARIEKLIQRRFPGLRRDFVTSYKKMFADGFFGTNIEEINNLSLIDRLNTYFKCGKSFGVSFDCDEQLIAKEIEGIETFKEVVEIADRLYQSASEKKEEEEQLIRQIMESEQESEEGDEYEQQDEDEIYESGESETSTVPDESEDDGEEEYETNIGRDESTTGGNSYESKEPISTTDEALSKNISNEFSSDSVVENINLSEEDVSQYIVRPKEILSLVESEDLERGQKHFKKFQANNKKTINYLVKEFEMKKKASEYARTSVSKTGIIDSVLMNNYRYSDDIFKKMSVIPEGKSHGLIMFLDWSGSMHRDMANTIDQLLNLVMFCKQVQIPFRVYAFTDRGEYWHCCGHKVEPQIVDQTTIYERTFRLMEFFNSKTMKRSEMNNMLNLLCWMKSKMYYGYQYIPRALNLGGTPLDQAINASPQLFSEFRKENRLDIVNMVFLTDGDSHSIHYKSEGNNVPTPVTRTIPLLSKCDTKKVVMTDTITKKTYKLSIEYGITSRALVTTGALLRRLRDRTGANIIGYRLLPVSKNKVKNELGSYVGDWSRLEQIYQDFKKNRFITIPNSGYTKYFALSGGKSLSTSNGSIEVSEDASKGQLRTAFKKANKSRKESRVMLSQFIDMVT